MINYPASRLLIKRAKHYLYAVAVGNYLVGLDGFKGRKRLYLTERLKKDYLPKLLQEFGFICVLCGESLKPGEYVFAHLNDKRLDSRLENVGLAHQSCNIKMVNDIDMKLKAQDLLKQREQAGFKYLENPTAIEEISSERKLNKLLYPFTKQYIEERINTDGKILLTDVLSEVCYVAQERYGAGAEPTIRRYVKQLTCGVAPFQIITDEKGKDWIVRRVGN